MPKRHAIAIALFVGIVAIFAPIAAALYLAQQQSLENQKASLAGIADNILQRSNETAKQIFLAFKRLEAVNAADPCSVSNIRLMEQIALSSDELRGIGYVTGNRLICSSLGVGVPVMSVGLPTYKSSRSNFIRFSVELPFDPGKKFLLVSHATSGYTAIIDPDQLLQVSRKGRFTSVGVLGLSSDKPSALNGSFDPDWLEKLGTQSSTQFSEGKNLVAVSRSPRYDFVAFAAVPLDATNAGFWRVAAILMPIGVATGLVLAVAVLYLARLQLALPALIKTALRKNEFFVLYQPVVDLRSGAWVGAEALIRWRRRDGEMVRPDLFIPVAEESGLITKITERVVSLIGQDAAGIFERFPDFHLAINVAAADLQSRAIVSQLAKLGENTLAKQHNLIVEVTERGMLKIGIAHDVLREFRSAGIQVAIDDFGTGYSSLSYLQRSPIDILKIDKSFVDSIGTDAATSQVVFHIIEMAKSLKLRTIAEGVETETQATVLRERGVEFAQGLLFSEALPLTELVAQLENKPDATESGPEIS